MKAILVIDVPLEDDDVRVEYLAYNHCGDLIKKGMDCKLKPMPKRMLAVAHIQYERIVNIQKINFAKGWNACLDEIAGKTE